jgi:hypothetical protein
MRFTKGLFAVAALVLVAGAIFSAAAGDAASKKPKKPAYHPVWLCRPGLANNPCATSLQTGIFSSAGALQSTVTPTIPSSPPIDCFYVYPTVSAETSELSDLKIQTAETDVALYQAAYYQSVCKIYAPMYHQVTESGAADPQALTPGEVSEQYKSVLDAWKYYLAHYNHGRAFVLIGHSQGAFVLRKLISRQIDSNPKLRKRMLSAILYGGAVVVKAGSLVGGNFKHVPGCTSDTELHCVVSYSSFSGAPPTGAVFGNQTWSPTDVQTPLKSGQEILCTNPAALSGGSGTLESVFPEDFPGTAGAPVPSLESGGGESATSFFEYTDSYTAQCVDSNGYNVLEVTPENGAPALVSTGALAPLWGLHQLDANLALGNLVSLVASETTAYQGG